MRVDIVNDLKSDYRKQRFHNAVEAASMAELRNALDDKSLSVVSRIIIKAKEKEQKEPLVPAAWSVYDKEGVFLYVTADRPALSKAHCIVPLYSETDLIKMGVL